MVASTEVRGKEFALAYQRRRTKARFVFYYPASALLALAVATIVFDAHIALAAALAGVAVVLWVQGERSYRCPNCGKQPLDPEGFEFNPFSCCHCGVRLKWKA
jgi:hypothetical protein